MLQTTIKTQFTVGAATILTLVCVGAALIEYNSMREQVLESVRKKAEIYLAAASATRDYVKDTLRPRMTQLMNSDDFVLEAMSTSFISREVMNRMHTRFPEFRYKRAAGNPRNPINLANKFESEMLQWFTDHPENDDWTGMINIEGEAFYSKFTPIYVEESCLSCHGDPAEAPKELRDKYGSVASYGYKVGDVAAAESIYIPMEHSMLKIKEKTWRVLCVGIITLLLVSALFYLLFNRTVITQLRMLLINLVSMLGEDEKHIIEVPEGAIDEMGQLKTAFGNVALGLKSAHDELKLSEQKYRILFEASPESIFICDADFHPVNINRSGMKLLRLRDHDEVYDMESIHQLFWDGRFAFSLMDAVKEKGVVREVDAFVVDRAGRKIDVIVTANRLLDEAGRFNGMELVIRDVTEKRKLDENMAQTEKMASIGQLAAGVAHEINNPLGVINCYSNLISKSVSHNSQVASDIEVIRKHTRSCKRVVDSLLNFARVDTPNMAHTDLTETIAELLAVFEHQAKLKGLTIKRQFSLDIPAVVCDIHKMRQVFMNLIINSFHAMAPGGELTVTTRMCKENGHVILDISDTGTGISENEQKKIFDPFFTTKKAGEGTGLGLAVSYGIIKQHRGDIKVHSTPGKGTTFSIHLPVDGEPCKPKSSM